MNAKVVFIVDIQARIKMFFYCLLQTNANISDRNFTFVKQK